MYISHILNKYIIYQINNQFTKVATEFGKYVACMKRNQNFKSKS